jgi:nicotinate-nucleotide adenylyltransferase
MKVGVFGSACNPPHIGHADVIQQALNVFDRVIVIPSYVHPFGKVMAPYDIRLSMVKAMADELDGGARVVVSDIERIMYEGRVEAGNPSPVFTYHLLCELDRLNPENNHVFIASHDILAPEIWSKFNFGDEIKSHWGVWEAKEQIKVRSTMIRQMVAQGVFSELPVCHGVKSILMNNRSIYDASR